MAEGGARGGAPGGAQGAYEFLVEIGDRIADGYRLTFAYPDPDSPTGTGGHTAVAPLDPADAALRTRLATLPTMVLASAARSRLAVSPMEQAARDVGDHLFRALTGGETLGELGRLRRRAQAAGADVRLTLHIRPPELAALPWEFLFDAREDRREFLGRSCMVTRRAGDLRAVPPLAVAGPLRVLAMVATPGDQAALDVERERAYLEQSLAPMRAAGRLELEWIPATKAALLAATQRRRWHIVHYIGHGDFDAGTGAGRLAFAAEDGAGTDWVTARQLATILGAHPTLRLVVLNACQSSAGSADDGQAGLAGALVHAGLAAVVAMQFPITDDAAPVFGREFYGALAAGEPVDRCVRAGRAAITLANDASLEWGTPVLHLRSADGVLFALEVEQDAPTATATATATASPAAEAEPWRPEPEPEPEPGPKPEPEPGTGRLALLQHIGLDLMHAKAKLLDEDYSEELVASLEQIVEGYRGLHGPEHQDTVSARKLLIKAREGLAAAGSTRFSLEDLFVKPRTTAPADDDPEDHPRTKTTRRATTERSDRPPRSSKAVRVPITLPGHKFDADILCLGYSAGMASFFGVGTADGTAHIFRKAEEQPLRLPHGPALPVRQILFSPDEQSIACLLGFGDRPSGVWLWTSTGLPIPNGGIVASHFAFYSADLFVAATGGHDLSLRRYATPFTPYTPYRGLSWVGDIAVSPDGRHVAALGDDRIVVWQALTGELVASFAAPEARLEMGLQFSADGSVLFASHTRHGVVRCDLGTGRSTPCVPPALADRRPVWALAPDGLAVGMPSFGAAAEATFWDVASPEIDMGRVPGEVSPLVRPVFSSVGGLTVVLPDQRSVTHHLILH